MPLGALFAFAFLIGTWIKSAGAADPQLDWEGWSPGLFTKAKAEQRFVILDLEAVWCHWCHVME